MEGRQPGLGLALATIMVLACTPRAGDVPEVIRAALLAQAAGPGGCRALEPVKPTTSAFFPGVRFYEAGCVREDGDTLVVNAAIDDDGTPFLLSSRSDFRFLLSQHPPVGIDSSNVVDYALTALFLTDEISGWAELVHDTTSVPDARVTWVTVSSGGRLLTYGTTVDRVSGEMVIIKQPEDR